MFVRYCPKTKAYKLYNPITYKVVVSRDVEFHEGSRWNWGANHQGEPEITVEELIEGSVGIVEDNSRF